jgi:hypothetical protein
MNERYLLALGSVIPVIFWGTLTVCGYVLGDYNHLGDREPGHNAAGLNAGIETALFPPRLVALVHRPEPGLYPVVKK